MVVLGIDPGYAIVGWGAISFNGTAYAPMGYGVITTPAGMELSFRLEQIYDQLEILINKARPDAISLEHLYFQNNQKTAINVAQARGVILLSAKKNSIPVYEYTPLQVKMAVTGYGQAKKPQIMEMTRRLLRLPEIPRPDDAADALAMAITHTHAAGTRLKAMIYKRGQG